MSIALNIYKVIYIQICNVSCHNDIMVRVCNIDLSARAGHGASN